MIGSFLRELDDLTKAIERPVNRRISREEERMIVEMALPSLASVVGEEMEGKWKRRAGET